MSKQVGLVVVQDEPNEPGQLSTSVLSFAGVEVDTSGPAWRISVDHKLDIAKFEEHPAYAAVRSFLEHLLRTRSASYVHNSYRWLEPLLVAEGLRAAKLSIREDGVLGLPVYDRFSKSLRGNGNTLSAYKSGFIRWYLWCCDAGFDQFDEDVANELEAIMFRRPAKGQAVLSQDPREGPLTPDEVQHVLAKLREAIEDATLPIAPVAAAWLMICFGMNSKNLRLMEEQDLTKYSAPDFTEVYELRVPRIKKRKSQERSEFRTRTVERAIGELLLKLIEKNRRNNPPDSDEFVGADGKLHRYSRPLFREATVQRQALGTPFEQYAYRGRVYRPLFSLKYVVKKLNLTDRDGNALNLTPRRLRYTLATRLVSNGASPREVADALDHSSTEHVLVYFNSGSELVQKLDRTIGPYLIPHAQAFLGKVVSGPLEAARGDDPASLIAHKSKTMEGLRKVGTCGEHGFCDLYAPVACYTCRMFQPWLEADHRAVLNSLMDERDERLLKGADVKWTQVNDRTIKAVKEVISICDSILTEEAAA